MLNYILIMIGTLIISMLTFLLLVKKDNEDQEDDIDTYVCNTCYENECVCEKEADTSSLS